MNRILLLILVAGLTFLVVLFVSRFDLIKDIWLWLVGLAGPIVKVADLAFKKAKVFLSDTISDIASRKKEEGKEIINEQ